MKRITTISLISALMILIFFIGCKEPERKLERPIKEETQAVMDKFDEDSEVIVIGLRGVSWDILGPMIEMGVTPNLARFKIEGAVGVLRPEAYFSLRSWMTLATGRKWEDHKITDYSMVVPSETQVVGKEEAFRVSLNDVESRTIWEIITTMDGVVGVYRWPVNWPGYDNNLGFLFPEWGCPDPDYVVPAWMSTMIKASRMMAKEDGRYRYMGQNLMLQESGSSSYDPYQAPEKFRATDMMVISAWEQLQNSCIDVETLVRRYKKLNSAWFVLDWGEVLVDFIDFMNQDSIDVQKRYNHVMALMLGRIDECIGDIKEQHPNAVIMVVSELGRPFGLAPKPGEEIIEEGIDGILLMHGQKVAAGVDLGTVYNLDIVPTVLHLSGLPAGADMPGRVLTDALIPELSKVEERIPSYDTLPMPIYRILPPEEE